MALIRNRNGIWQARITRKGHAPISKSFTTKKDAEHWTKHVEVNMQKSGYINFEIPERTTLVEILRLEST